MSFPGIRPENDIIFNYLFVNVEQAAPPPIVLIDTLFALHLWSVLYTHSFAEQAISSDGFGVVVPMAFCGPFGAYEAHSVSFEDIACGPSTLIFGLQQ